MCIIKKSAKFSMFITYQITITSFVHYKQVLLLIVMVIIPFFILNNQSNFQQSQIIKESKNNYFDLNEIMECQIHNCFYQAQ